MSVVKPKAIINAPTSVEVNTLVTLDGSQSTGNIVKWHWIQKGGKKVKITDADKSIASFTPTVKGTYKVKLKIDDANKQIGRAFATIIVGTVTHTCKEHAHWDTSLGKCVCDAGFQDDGKGNCIPDTTHVCPDVNSHWDGNACVCNKGFHDEGGVCVPDTPPPPCPENAHWDAAQKKCVCNTGFHLEGAVCVPNITPPTCPAGQHWDETLQACIPDAPTGDLLYDSNTDIDWGAIAAGLKAGETSLKVTDTYGTFKPNGKYFRMKASGSPRMYLYPATKELVLEHDGKYGRAYFGVCNYASRLECDFKLDSCSNGFSAKLRNRHQYHDIDGKAPNTRAQGGMGLGIHCTDVDNDLEIFHDGGGEVSGPQKPISPKLEANKYYHVNFSQFDKSGKIHIDVELDGKKINDGDLSAPSQFFNKAEFMEWSEFWVRYNADNGGRLTFKNLRLFRL